MTLEYLYPNNYRRILLAQVKAAVFLEPCRASLPVQKNRYLMNNLNSLALDFKHGRQLNDSKLVTIDEAGEEGDFGYAATELGKGQDLHALAKRGGVLPITQTNSRVEPVAVVNEHFFFMHYPVSVEPRQPAVPG